MADNLTVQSATPATVPANSVIATDDVGGVHFPKYKLDVGGDGVSAMLSSANPIPVSEANSAAINANLDVINTATSILTDLVTALGGDDTAFASPNVMTAGFVVDETSINTLDENDVGAARVDASRRQLARIVGADDANRLDVDASGHAQVDIAAQSQNLTVVGGAPHDQQPVGNPVLVAGFASSVPPNAVTDADVARLWTTQNGALHVADGGSSLTVDGTVNAAQSGTWNVTNVSGTVSLPTGAATSAKQDTGNTALAAIQTAVEALDNTVSGNELQVDVLTSALPSGAATAAKQPALGTAGSASADVITVQGIASMTAIKVDGSAVTQPVSGTVTANPSRPSTPSQSSVNDSASSVTLLSANANRLGATIFNDSAVELYLKLGATASTTSFTCKMLAGAYYEVPFGYTGIIDGIWASDGAGAARITELSA